MKDKQQVKSASARLEDEIVALAKAAKINDWTDFVEALGVPDELLPAVMTGRGDLVKLVKPRPMSEKEAKVLLDLIAGLLDTNAALRLHARQTAQLVDNWAQAFNALRGIGAKIQRFAYFKHSEVINPEEEEEVG